MNGRDPWYFQRWAVAQTVGNPTRKLLLVSLALTAESQTGYGWVTQGKLAAFAECSERSVRGHLAELEAAGLIERRHEYAEGGGRQADGFLLLAEDVVSWPDGTPTKTADSAGTKPAESEGIPAKAVAALRPTTTTNNGSTDVEPASASAPERVGERVNRSALTVDQRYVLDELAAVAGAKGKALDEAAALRACLDYSDRDHVRQADRFRHWHLEGKGRTRRPAKSLAAQWRTWLRNSDVVEPRRRSSAPASSAKPQTWEAAREVVAKAARERRYATTPEFAAEFLRSEGHEAAARWVERVGLGVAAQQASANDPVDFEAANA